MSTAATSQRSSGSLKRDFLRGVAVPTSARANAASTWAALFCDSVTVRVWMLLAALPGSTTLGSARNTPRMPARTPMASS